MPIFNTNIMIKLPCLAILMVWLCTGCGTGPLYYTSTFDKAQTEQMMRPGRNTIIVNTFTKSPNNGSIITCVSTPTTLIPATERSAEYVRYLFGSMDGGQAETRDMVFEARRIQNGDDPDLMMFKAEQVCDSKGFATFKKVGDGEFYVFSGTPRNEGYSYMYAGKVQVRGGETKTVVLHGQSYEKPPPRDPHDWISDRHRRYKGWDRHRDRRHRHRR